MHFHRDSFIVARVSGPRSKLVTMVTTLIIRCLVLKCEVWEMIVWVGFYYFSLALFYTIT